MENTNIKQEQLQEQKETEQVKRRELEFTAGWAANLLNAISSEEKAGRFLSKCADFHYSMNQMDDLIAPYVGDLEGWIQFLEKEWGWKIHVSEDRKTLLVDENKNFCVCPVARRLQSLHQKVSPALCHCSENFAAKMFSKVLGKQVTSKVVRSFLRDQKSCIYEITLPAVDEKQFIKTCKI